MLCPIKVSSNTIKLTVHTSCYCVVDLLCVKREREREKERERERERERCISLSPSLPLKEEFFLYQKLWDLLDYGEKVDKSATNNHCRGGKCEDLWGMVSSGICHVLPELENVEQEKGVNKRCLHVAECNQK